MPPTSSKATVSQKPTSPILLAGVVVEQDRLGRLAAADQRGVGRELAEEVGLAGAARAQLDEVEVRLDQRRQPGDEVQLQRAASASLGSSPTDRRTTSSHSSRVKAPAGLDIGARNRTG